MTRRTRLMAAVLLAVCPALHAQDGFVNSLQYAADEYEWRQIDVDGSAENYRQAVRHNRRLARDTLRDTVVSLGVPETGVNLMGLAIALAFDDLKLNLHKAVALEIEDPLDKDRISAFIEVKFDW